MTIEEKLKAMQELQAVKTPWHVMRIFGNVNLFGDNVGFANGDSDYVTLEEFQQALGWLVEQSGGIVKWKGSKK